MHGAWNTDNANFIIVLILLGALLAALGVIWIIERWSPKPYQQEDDRHGR